MFQPDLLKDQVILITGGGTGLGKSMARRFLELGAAVIIASRRKNVVESSAAELAEATGGRITGFELDVRDYRQVEEVIQRSVETFSTITGLVNNAAGNFISPTERLSHKAFEVIVDIVLHGSTNCTLALGKHWLRGSTPGRILNIVTTYASTGSGYVVPSAVAKAGVLALTRSLAVEWGARGITMNAVAPGPFPTPGAWERLLPPGMEEQLIKRIPLRRAGEHQELTDLAAYLMAPQAGYINGEVITIDGGEWLQGAGEFNFMERLTPEMWQAMEEQVRKANRRDRESSD